MKCPECVAAGLRSTITVGGSFSTAMGWAPHFDEDGVYHVHDYNTRTTQFSCSQGHRWAKESDPSCPAAHGPPK